MKKSEALQKIKVCPFLDMSSFEVEPILQKRDQSSIASDIENARCTGVIFFILLNLKTFLEQCNFVKIVIKWHMII